MFADFRQSVSKTIIVCYRQGLRKPAWIFLFCRMTMMTESVPECVYESNNDSPLPEMLSRPR